MNKIYQALTSRTFWTVVLIVAVSAFPQVTKYLPSEAVDLINAILLALAGYFHVNPSKDYGYTPFVGIHKDPENL